jgi:hypothetical protein
MSLRLSSVQMAQLGRLYRAAQTATCQAMRDWMALMPPRAALKGGE